MHRTSDVQIRLLQICFRNGRIWQCEGAKVPARIAGNFIAQLDVDVITFGRRCRSKTGASVLVSLDVLVVVVGSHETFSALATLETFFARVRSEVTLEFIGASERLVAVHPLTHERPLSAV